MGICCCKSLPCDKSSNKDSKSPIDQNNDNINLITSVSDDEDNTNEQISELLLCENTMTELCPISLKLINILSTYHLFIHNYNPNQQQLDFKNNICDIICTKMDGYDVLNLRNDYHHMITYHDANDKFMQTVFNKIMELNKNNHKINNLYNITTKLDNDEQKRNYFGHLMDDEISMIQCLNQIHHDCTYNYMHNHNNNNSHIDDNNIDSSHDDSADDIQQICRKPTPNLSNYVEKDTNNKEQHIAIDIKYTKTDKEKRKIGKLKLKKALKKKKRDKLKLKQQKIQNDDSWMNKEYKKNKKSKHVASDSIQLLGNTKLVSNNLWRKSLDVLQENTGSSFDLTSFDIADLERDTEDSSNDMNYIKRERKEAMFCDQYNVDQI